MLNTAIIGRWKEKYSEQHHGATGDATTAVAVTSYREHHHLLDNLTQVAYEKYTRAAYTEFVLNDPWYIVQLKYYNLMTVTDVSKTVITQAWGYLGWRGLALIACVAVALVAQIRSNTESFTVLTGLAGSLIVCAIMAAGPISATVAEYRSDGRYGNRATTCEFHAGAVGGGRRRRVARHAGPPVIERSRRTGSRALAERAPAAQSDRDFGECWPAQGSGSGADGSGGLPVPRQQVGDAFGRVVGDPREDVGEIGLRVDAVEFCCLDQ